MKKKIVSLCLVVALLAVMVVGGTLAYFTDKDAVSNSFTVGNVKIDLSETTDVKDGSGTHIDGKVTSDDNGASYINIMPGNYMQKEIVVKNTGDNTAYVRVELKHNNYLAINNAIDEVYENKVPALTENDIQAKVDEVFNGWDIVHDHINNSCRYTNDRTLGTVKDGVELIDVDMAYIPAETNLLFDKNNMFQSPAEENSADYSLDASEGGTTAGYYSDALDVGERIYVYYLKLAAGESYKLIDGLTCPTDFNADQAAMFNGLQIDAKAYAIQAEGFATDKAAFEALATEFPIQ